MGLDLRGYLYNSSVTKYNKAFNNCIAIYVIDYIVYKTYIDCGIKPELFLAYSMGLITAMACGKSISFEAGLHTIINVYDYSESASRRDEAMAVVVGLTCSDVSEIIKRSGSEECVEVASENNEYCIVISGKRSGVENVMKIASDEGALKVKDVKAPFAFHTHYAAEGIEKHIEFISKMEVFDSEVPVVSVYTQDLITKVSDLQKELMKNLVSRMYWKKSIEKIAESGIDNFAEVSLGDSITKFSKLINIDYKFLTYNKFLSMKS